LAQEKPVGAPGEQLPPPLDKSIQFEALMSRLTFVLQHLGHVGLSSSLANTITSKQFSQHSH
jgi:hypothetical protein